MRLCVKCRHMDRTQAEAFLKRYAAGEHTVEEHVRFLEWLHSASTAETEHLLDVVQRADFGVPNEFDEGLFVERMEVALDANDPGLTPGNLSPISRSFSPLLRLGIAASLLLFTTAGIWYLRSTGNEDPAVVQRSSGEEIHSGVQKPRLILSDGSEVTLDSGLVGNIETGTDLRLVKSDDLLRYSGSGGGQEAGFHTLVTPKGAQFRLTLSDGTRVWLNAASSLRYPVEFEGAERRVELAGEAYFEVAPMSRKPFRVSTNGMDVEVLGTRFNINCYMDEQVSSTTLVEGSVRVSTGRDARTIRPGQQASSRSDGRLGISHEVDLDQVLAWKNGEFNFNDADLQDVMRQLARWYDVEIHYEGLPSKRRFGGEVQRSLSLQDVLKLLEKNNVHFRIEGRRLVVMP